MILKNFPDTIKKLKNSKNKTMLMVVIGIVAIVLIALSGIKPSDSTDSTDLSTEFGFDDNGETYKKQITSELEDILNKIDGVGECEVMLSVEGTQEYIFAENVDKSQEYSSNGSNDRLQNEVVLIDKNGNRQALVKKIVKPKISGVVVVCRGGGEITIKERVIKAVSAALNLSYGKICVECKK